MLHISLSVSPLLRVIPLLFTGIILLLCHILLLSAMSAVCAAVNSDLVLRLKFVNFTSNIIIYPITLVCSLFYNLLGIYTPHQ